MKAIYSIIQGNYIRFLRYSFVGVLNTAVDIGIFTLLYTQFGVDPLMAHIAGFSVAVINSYAWNALWTFKDKASPWRFFAVAFAMLALSSLILWVLNMIIPVIPGKILVTVLTVLLGYYANARFVFKA